MIAETIAMIWFIVGILYAFVNGAIRKIDTDGDWLLPIAWITLWPMMIPSIIGYKLYQKCTKKDTYSKN
jgi:hypothetical protein